MGKRRKFAKFIRWIKSDLPEDNKSVLLLGVTKIPSPTPRTRPHTLHLDHHLSAKSQTLDYYPFSRTNLDSGVKSHSNDSLIKSDSLPDITIENPSFIDVNGTLIDFMSKNENKNDAHEKVSLEKIGLKPNEKYSKRVSFQSDQFENEHKLGFCTELPFEFYHPESRVPGIPETDDVTPATQGIMDKSVDSIGSCSLDVDASSTDFSDSSLESSNCTLRSAIRTPNKEKPLPTFHFETSFTDVEVKKPSYLNLACTVNGYSNITNYDSKLRENFRVPKSREVSPIRPNEYHVTEPVPPQNIENSKFLTPNFNKSQITSPSKMAEKSHTVLQSVSFSSSTTRTTYMSKETKNFTRSMLYDDDTVDSCINKNNRMSGKFTSYETSKVSHCSYVNLNGQERSFSENAFQENFCTNGQGSQNNLNPIVQKSFIQQRVERLYGPAALAQGFFISKRLKNRNSESETSENSQSDESSVTFKDKNELDNSSTFKQSYSSPSLPVLRHLRPEFRAQLPILTTKRTNVENSMQKSTTVPLSLTSVSNGVERKSLLNGSKSVESIENKENIEKQVMIDDTLKKEHEIKRVDIIPSKIITEEIPAAPQVILPISKPEINGTEVNGVKNEINGGEAHSTNGSSEVKDGHYFLIILKNETDRLIRLAEKIEHEMEVEKTDLPDEILGYLRSASGKARLLVTQKMQQFEGLCHKNINQIPGEPFPTTAEDLQGFWDMVMLQVTQVDQLFVEIDTLRKNNWVIEEKVKPEITETTKPKKIIIKKAVSANAEAQRKQREAARKKMLEDRRKAMREKQQQEKGIEIFVPESS